MVYTCIENRLGVQPIADINTVAQHTPGTVVRAQDPTYGTGEFVYLKGGANTVVGHSVIWEVEIDTNNQGTATTPLVFATFVMIDHAFRSLA